MGAATSVLLALAVSGAAMGIAGCSSAPWSSSSESSSSSELDSATVQQVASEAGVDVKDVEAIVSGKIITHKDVDVRVQRMRSVAGITDDASFSSYLDSAGMTELDYRYKALKQLIDEALIVVDGENLGVTVSTDEVNAQIQKLESRYPSHAAFVAALQAAGYTEDSYYNAVAASILSSSLREKVTSDIEPTEEQIREYATSVAPTLAGKRSSQILLSQSDYSLALSLRQQLMSGANFAELAQKYSIDGSGSSGGDMGWESLTSMSNEYKKALDQLEVGEISPIVRSEFGYHIILCTDEYEPTYDEDGKVDVDSIPTELMDAIKQSMTTLLTEYEYETYVSNLEASATLAVFDEDGNQVDPADVGLATETVEIDSNSAVDLVEDAASDGSAGEAVFSAANAASAAGDDASVPGLDSENLGR
jgi:foldase protein PrsA